LAQRKYLCREHWAFFRERQRRGESPSLKLLTSNPQTAEDEYLAYAQRLSLVGSAA
jgi:hypothetical protein